ncbi:hypothetical protein H310_08784 [Aphanomyces invadans]|uniref:Uncharacterized protein n=1 Tax=Aphanomyces invadans TaxID=157072 RepID=A0A024TYG9_9STRA|nr:hypothetical protein H310_08784 [Aphanomyces invadans]ETV98681.1 hypothetical protein H310_08784 [Aphanomyces invadans]|eukprot:XP_008872878.1 hypothetical protein H310_08784 [Aphanomyces invadans]
MTAPAAVVPYHALHDNGFAFMAGNEFIRSGYRVHYSSKDCVRSLFQWHNETWNVWIHIVGSVVFLALFVTSVGGDPGTTTPHLNATSAANLVGVVDVPQWPMILFLSSIVSCFALSTTYYLLYVQNDSVASVYLQMDFAGIIAFIVGCYVPSIYYAFYCDPTCQAAYLGVVGVLAVGLFVALGVPSIGRNKVMRVKAFLGLIFFAVVPIGHAIFAFGFWDDHVQLMIKPAVTCSVFSFLGLFLYVTRLPERWYPGKFDVVGSSHQWWHLCVVLAALAYYTSLLDHYTWRSKVGCRT